MQRLIQGVGQNSPTAYDKIYLQRKEAGIDVFDLKRWNKLLKFYKGGRLIELGCLDSLVPQIAKKKYPHAEIWAIDIAKKTIDELEKKYPNIYYQVGDVYRNRFPQNYFDYCVAGELIEHLERPEDFLRETFRVLKNGGTLALSTPKGETKKGEVDKERHLWSYEIDDIKKLLEPYGEIIIKVMRSQYFPRYIYHFPTIIAYVRKTRKTY